MINGYDAAIYAVEGVVIASAGYVGAWFAAGPKSGLKDPNAGAIMALAAAVTYAIAGRQIYKWAMNNFQNDQAKAISATVITCGIGGLITARLCGYPVSLSDIDVLAIGLIIGIPVALIGFAITIPLTKRLIYFICGKK